MSFDGLLMPTQAMLLHAQHAVLQEMTLVLALLGGHCTGSFCLVASILKQAKLPLLQGLPLDGASGTVATYGLLLGCMGLLISWAAPACNNPIFAEIVPPHLRTMIYAFDRSFESAIAASAAPLVGILAEKVFGWEVGPPHPQSSPCTTCPLRCASFIVAGLEPVVPCTA